MLKRNRKIFVLLFLIIALHGQAEDKNKSKDNLSPILKEWKATLLYGIDTEILDVVKKIRETKERSLDIELLTVLKESKNNEVKKSILDYFTEEENTSALEYSINLLDTYDDEPVELVMSVLSYTGSIASKNKKILDVNLKEKLLKDLKDIIDNATTNLASLAVRTLGKAGYKNENEYLLKKLDDTETDEKIKPEIILALGNMKSEKAVDKLIEILKNTDNSRIERMYASSALGMIGDKKAAGILRKTFSSKDALLRIYAASALSKLEYSEETVKLLIEGLKDSNWKVRVECAKALGAGGSKSAIDILEYKVEHDPEKKVQIESIRALGMIKGKKVMAFLKSVFENENRGFYIREEALQLLVDNYFNDSISGIEKIVKTSTQSYNKVFIEHVARIVSLKEEKKSKGLLVMFLNSSDPIVRIYGLRGVANNKLKELLKIVKSISESDPNSAVKKEALSAIEKLK